MSSELIKIIKLEENIYGNYNGFTLRLHHTGLEESKTIFGTSLVAIEFKANSQLIKWENKWIDQKDFNPADAVYLNSFISNQTDSNELLSVNFDDLQESFVSFKEIHAPEEPELLTIQEKPEKDSPEFQPKFSLVDNLFSSKKESKIIFYKNKFEHALRKWEKEKFRVESINSSRLQKYELALKSWNKRKKIFDKNSKDLEKKKTIYKSFLNDLKILLDERNEYAIAEFADLILSKIQIPDFLSDNFETDYCGVTQTLTIDFEFPDRNCLSKILTKSLNKDITGNLVPKIESEKLFDAISKLVYNTASLVLSSLFTIDKENYFKKIVFNGYFLITEKIEGEAQRFDIFSIAAEKEKYLNEVGTNSTSEFLNKFNPAIIDQINYTDQKPVKIFNSIRKQAVSNSKNIVLCGFSDGIFGTLKVNRKSYDGLLIHAISKEFNVSIEEMNFTELQNESFEAEFTYNSEKFLNKVLVKSFKNTLKSDDIKKLLLRLKDNSFNQIMVFTTGGLSKNATGFIVTNSLKIYENSDIYKMFITHNSDYKNLTPMIK